MYREGGRVVNAQVEMMPVCSGEGPVDVGDGLVVVVLEEEIPTQT